MKISRDQYEAWFLDYLEGNLEESMIGDFLSFLEENPDLAEELELFDPVSLPRPEMVYPKRNQLYKRNFDRQEVFDSAAVGLLEDDLDVNTRGSFETYLKEHPEKLQEMELFRQTKLRPDTDFIFENKHRLYHSTRHLRLTPTLLLKIAALVVLVMILPVISEKSRNIPLPVIENPAFSSVIQNNAESFPESIPVNVTSSASTGQNSGNLPVFLPVKAVEKIMEKELVAEENSLLAASGRTELPPLLSAYSKNDPLLLKTGDPELMFAFTALDMLAQNETEEVYLSEKLARKIGLSNLNMGKVVRWGLTLASGLSKGKFNYSTSESGDIIALNLDTRLLGFSIPVSEK